MREAHMPQYCDGLGLCLKGIAGVAPTAAPGQCPTCGEYRPISMSRALQALDTVEAMLGGANGPTIQIRSALASSPVPQPVGQEGAQSEVMVIAAAKMLCKLHAGQCQVDEADTWKVYGEQFLADARDALHAAFAALASRPQSAEPQTCPNAKLGRICGGMFGASAAPTGSPREQEREP